MKNTLLKIQKKILDIPLALTAVALGLTTLGTAWGQYSKNNADNLPGISFNANWVQYLTIALATILLILSLLKVISNPKWFYQEMKNGSSSSHLPVLFMVIMAIGEFVINHGALYNNTFYFGLALWYIGLLSQLLYLGWWLVTRTIWFDIRDVDAAWYVPIVGIPVACAISPDQLGGGNYVLLLQILWYFSFVGFLLLTCLILYRYLFVSPIHTVELPALGIIAAPASLLLVTYYFDFVTVKEDNAFVIFFLAGLAITFTFITYISMIKIFMMKFNPGFAAYSFPLAIGAVARIVFATWLHDNWTASESLFVVFKTEAFIELVISSIIMFYLLVAFTIHVISKMFNLSTSTSKCSKIISYFG